MSHPIRNVARMTIRTKNPRIQGRLGLTTAIDWFTRAGYEVALPLNDCQPYDLIVDHGEGPPRRVQVKTTTHRKNGNYVVALRTCGGNQSFSTRKPFDRLATDLLFVLTDDDEVYLFPSVGIVPMNALTLCAKYDRYRQVRHPTLLCGEVVGEGFEPGSSGSVNLRHQAHSEWARQSGVVRLNQA